MTHHSGIRRITALFVMLWTAPFLAGCGVMFGGTTKTISVTSAPAGAHLTTVPSTAEFTTPTSFSLERKHSYTIKATKDGYKEAQAQIQKRMRTGPLVLDILFTGLLGVVIDAATGGWYDLQPEYVTMALEQADPAMDGPDVITVTVSFSKYDSDLTRVSATAPVHIEVVKN